MLIELSHIVVHSPELMIVPVVRSAIPLQSLSDQARFIHYMTGADTSTVSIWVSYAKSLLQRYFLLHIGAGLKERRNVPFY